MTPENAATESGQERFSARASSAQLHASGTIFAAVSFIAGITSPFTVNIVGEMPIGEVLLFGVALYGLGFIILERRWPVPLLASPVFRALMLSQLVAFGGYVLSDLYRGSDSHDFMRGWARMIFLTVDLFATTFLFGVSAYNSVLMGGLGAALGLCLYTKLVGPLFGDYWKFGYGGPLTIFLVIIAPALSLSFAPLAVAAMGCLHLALGFRSLGAECLMLSVLLVVLRFPPRIRLFILPVFVTAGTAAALLFYSTLQGAGEGSRSTRSNVERSAMMTAAWEGFAGSPLVGQGSWFSKSNVMTHFVELRTEWAAEQGVGGFDASDTGETMAVHSQILVSLAEGGLLGGCFFIVYGLSILWTLGYCVLLRPLDASSAVYLLILLTGLSNLLFSPFSGVHREGIAVVVGIIMVCWQQWHQTREALAAAGPRWQPSSGWQQPEKGALAPGASHW